MAERVVIPRFKFDPQAIEMARQRMRPPTEEEAAERSRAVQALARDVGDAYTEISPLPGEASQSVEQARVAAEEFGLEHALTLERAHAGVRDLAAATQVDLDAALESLLAQPGVLDEIGQGGRIPVPDGPAGRPHRGAVSPRSSRSCSRIAMRCRRRSLTQSARSGRRAARLAGAGRCWPASRRKRRRDG